MSNVMGPHLIDLKPLALLSRTIIEDDYDYTSNDTTQYKSSKLIIQNQVKSLKFNEDIAVLYYSQKEPAICVSKSLTQLRGDSSMHWVNPSIKLI